MSTGGPFLPKDIDNPQRIGPMMPTGGADMPRDAGTFQSLVQQQATAQPPPKGMGATQSPFELAKGGAPQLAAGPNMTTIQQQVLHAQTTVGDLNNMFNTQNLKIKPSAKYLLRNKLSEANQQLHTVNSKVGGQAGEEEESDMPAGSGPFKKFLGYITGSQVALNSTQKKIEELSKSGESLNPAEMLFVQVKLSRAQQLLDYSSILLSKAIEDMKQLFNVQL